MNKLFPLLLTPLLFSGCANDATEAPDSSSIPVKGTKKISRATWKPSNTSWGKEWPLRIDTADLNCSGTASQPHLTLTYSDPQTGKSGTYALNVIALNKTTPYLFEGDLLLPGNGENGKKPMEPLFLEAMSACTLTSGP